MQETEGNLVDEVWGTARPPYPTEAAFTLNETRYTGLTWCEKLAAVASKVRDSGATAHVVSALDEVTWLLNVRAHDIEYLPVVRSYLILELRPEPSVAWFVHPSKLTRELRDFLRHCAPHRVKIFEYEKFWAELRDLGTRTSSVLLPQAFSYNLGASHAIFSALPEEKVKFGPPPVAVMKNQKNPTEVQGMKNAHVRDAAALIIFLAKLEAGIKAGDTWTEQRAADELARTRSRQPLNRGLSFDTISASGSHSAMPHYAPTADTDAPINNTAIYMLDSGGQYLDGTTDVTRTLHFGTPTNDQRATYTRLLAGCIRLVSAVFPAGTTLKELDILVRGPLYVQGRNFGHGTTHGIGHFLGVHEAYNSTLVENFFGSQEPGYYVAGQWGMRLENIVTVVKAEFPENHNENDEKFLKFEPVTLVPYEPNLIDVTLLSDKQVDWLNKYHARVRAEVRPLLESQCEYQAIAWLDARTQAISWSKTADI
ncbi:hypothetical protein B566_EDAN012634 [Ephemera danica]|nr:hypothetical protein B566_EDAN012634 [Ephemera danica]